MGNTGGHAKSIAYNWAKVKEVGYYPTSANWAKFALSAG